MTGARRHAALALLLLSGCVRSNAAFGDDVVDTTASTTDEPTTQTGDDPTEPGTTNPDPTEPDTNGDADAETTEDADVCDVPLSGCNTFAQDCGDGEACKPTAGEQGDGTRCVANGDGPIGAPCEPLCGELDGIDDCAGDGFCDVFADEPTCIPLCRGSVGDPECPQGSTCLRRFVGDEVVGLCRPSCRPLDPDDCEGDQACVVTINGGVCAPVDDTLFPAVQGIPCSDAGFCGFGFVCIDGGRVEGCPDENGRCCAQQCDTTDPDACDELADSSCVPYGELEGDEMGPFVGSFGGCALPG